MSKIAVVYWSGTGNTEIMANKVTQRARETTEVAPMFDSCTAGFKGKRIVLSFSATILRIMREKRSEGLWAGLLHNSDIEKMLKDS